MRVLIPYFRSIDDFGDNVAATLEEMGHEVAMLPPISNRVMSTRLFQVARRIRREGMTPIEWLATRVARRFRPDVVLALTQSTSEACLAELRRLGARRLVVWWGDTPANMRGLGILSPEWDAIFIKDRAAVAKFRRVGLPAHHLHEAANPRWHRVVAGRSGDDVAIAGNAYEYRQAVIRRLVEAGVPVSLYGPAPPAWAAQVVRSVFRNRYVTREEKSRVFGAALAALNTTALSEGDSLNCRAFEIAAAGGLQLIERRPSVAECFEPGREILDFDSFDELLSHLDRARRFPAEADAIRAAAARRVVAEHTYRHRLEEIFRIVR